MQDITRETVDDTSYDFDVRLYTVGEKDLASVTTILKTLEDDKGNLHDWQNRNDGEGDNAHHEHLFWYSRQLGTLGHWCALRNLAEGSLPWTADEASSLWALQHVPELTDDSIHRDYSPELDHDFTIDGSNHEEIWDATPREVLYSNMRGDRDKGGGTVASWGEFYDKHPPYRSHDYYTEALMDHVQRDTAFFEDAQQRLWSKLDMDEIITVEEFLFVEEHNYAGQVDLVYVDDNNNVVVADLKSSSGCYDKHQIQGAAYAKAIELSDLPVDRVDRLEVHRAHPRTGQMAVHTHRDAPGKKPLHTTKYWNDSYEDLWAQFKKLADEFDYEN